MRGLAGSDWTRMPPLPTSRIARRRITGSVVAALVLAAAGVVVDGTPAWASAASPPAAARFQERAVLDGMTVDRLRRAGNSVAVSGDGHTIVVGAPPVVSNQGDPGRAFVYTGGGRVWRLQATLRPALAPPYQSDATAWGQAVAISADGDHIAVGDSDEFLSGAVDTFRRLDGDWGSGVRVYPPDRYQGEYFGAAIALSGDGRRLLVGAREHNDHYGQEGPGSGGAAWVFTADAAGDWGQPREVDPPHDGYDSWEFGNSVALSAGGTTALVGSVNYASSKLIGLTQTDSYRLDAAGDARHTHMFPPVLDHPNDFEATTLALSADGRTAVIGAPGAVPPTVAVFDVRGTGWARVATFTGVGTSVTGGFGYAVALSGDGHTLVVGAPRRTSDQGRTSGVGGGYRFSRDAAGWHWGGLVYAATPRRDQLLGSSVALSNDGTTAVLGAPTRGWANLATSGATVFTMTGFRPATRPS